MRWILFGVALLAVVPLQRAQAEGIRQEPLQIPAVIGGRTYRLEGLVVRPDDGQPHPLALINHGSPRDAADRPGMSPNRLWLQAAAFARRGWTAVTFLRRGYGHSGGGWVENYGSCSNPDYTSGGRTAAADLAAVARYMLGQPYVTKDKWISVGVSAGGFATIALTADAPPGLSAAIAFAPGRGSRNADEVCGERQLVAAFATFGKTSRTPVVVGVGAERSFLRPEAGVGYDRGVFEGGRAAELCRGAAVRRRRPSVVLVRKRHADLDADGRSLSGRQQADLARPPDRDHHVRRRGAGLARR